MGFVYLDDIVVLGDTWETHCNNVRRVLSRLQQSNLSLLSLPNVRFSSPKWSIWGMGLVRKVSNHKRKVEAMEKYPPPLVLKELQAFLGATNYYRKFIKNFAISRPLIDLRAVRLRMGEQS